MYLEYQTHWEKSLPAFRYKFIFASLKTMGGRKCKEKLLFSDTNQKFFKGTEGQKGLHI